MKPKRIKKRQLQEKTTLNCLPGFDRANDPQSMFNLKATASAIELMTITGRSDMELRNLAANQLRPDGTPWIPKPVSGLYATLPTLRGLVQFLEYSAQRRGRLPVFDSMDQCAEWFGWTKTFLQQLKKDNCPGFRGSRIYSQELLSGIESWLTGTSETDHLDLLSENVRSYSELHDKYQGLTERENYRAAIGETMLKADTLRHLGTIKTIHASSYDRIVEELPAQLAGRNADEIRTTLEQFISDMLNVEEKEIAIISQSSSATPMNGHEEESRRVAKIK